MHQVLAGNARKCWRTGLPHDCRELAVQDVDHGLNALLAKRRQPPGLRPADADGGRSECYGLEDVRATSDPAIKETGTRPLTAATTSGRQSSVARRVSSFRPP